METPSLEFTDQGISPKQMSLRRITMMMKFQPISRFDHFLQTSKVLKNFNIDPESYKSIKDPNEKKEFVIQQAKSYMQDQLKQFDTQIKLKRTLIQKKKNAILEEQEKDQVKTDHYPWLDIKVPHKKNLEWRLKNELIQKLQIPQDIQKKYPEQKRMKTSLSQADVQLDNILQQKDVLSSGAVLQQSIASTFDNFVKTFEQKLMDDDQKHHHRKVIQFISIYLQCNCNSCGNHTTTNKSNTIFSMKGSHTKNSKSRQLNDGTQNNTGEVGGGLSSTISQMLYQRPQSSYQPQIKSAAVGNLTSKKKAAWTDLDEQFYRSYRSEMRERLTNDSKTGPWEQVMLGFLRKMETQGEKSPVNEVRKDDPLEIQLINKVNSILELNNCLDQKLIQKKLNKMSSYELDEIETGLANKIIDEYEQEKDVIKERRYSYLKQKARALSEEIHSAQQKQEKDERIKLLQKQHKEIANRMRIILNGLDKKLINIKSKPATKFDYLFKNKYPYNNPLSKQVKMKIPQNWDSYKTLNLFEYFKVKQNEVKVPVVKRFKFTKEKPMEYFAQKNTGGPIIYEEEKEKHRRAPLKIVMNAIKIWKTKKSSWKDKNKSQQPTLRRNLTLNTMDTENNGRLELEQFTYNDLQKAIFNNDHELIDRYASMIPEDVVNKLNLEKNTCLYEAVKFKMHEIVDALLKIPSIDVNARCEQGNTALHAAFLIKDVELVRKLMRNRAKADIINMQRKLPHQMTDKEFVHEIGFDLINLRFLSQSPMKSPYLLQ